MEALRAMQNRHIAGDKCDYGTAGFQDHDLLALLKRYREQHYSNPRNLAYSLLGLVTPYIWMRLPIDYSLSVNEVFKSVARYIIQGSQRLEIICNSENYRCFCNTGLHKLSKLPS
jgi:hypothetical protein